MKSRGFLLVLLPIFVSVSGCNLDPESAKKRYLESGNKYFASGKYKEASIMYRNALRKDPRYGEAYYRLGLTHLELMRLMDAAATFRRSVELQPENADAYVKLTDLYLLFYTYPPNRRKIFPEMQDLFALLGKYRKGSYEYFRLGGYLDLTQGKTQDAEAKFAAANKVKPGQPDLVLIYAQTLAAAGKVSEGEALVRNLLQKNKSYMAGYDFLYITSRRGNRPDDAEKLMKEEIAANPLNLRPRIQLAMHYASLNQRREMRAALDYLISHHKDFPGAHKAVGDFYYRLGEPEAAMATYRAGAKANPKESSNYQKLVVEVLAGTRRYPEALALVEEQLKADPKDSQAIAMRAGLWLQSGDTQKLQAAITDLESVVSKMPDNHVLRFNLGNALLAKGDLSASQIQFEEAVKRRPDYIPPRVALAEIHLLRRAYPKVIQTADEVLKYDPNLEMAHLLRTAALMGMNDFKQAKLEVAGVLKRNPNSRDAVFQSAMIAFVEGNFKDADAGFRKLYDLNPPDLRGLMGLTEVYMAQKQTDAAIQLMQKEIAAQPQRTDYHIALANVSVRAQRFDLAIAEYKKYLEKQPNSPSVYVRLGETYRRKGDLKSAEENFRKARQLDPRNASIQLQLALLLESSGRRPEARPMYDEILNLQPDNGVALNNLAYILAEEGKELDRAQSLAERARQTMPKDPAVADTLGWIYIRKNLSDNAIRIFVDLTAAYPKVSTFHYHLGMAYLQKGDKGQARKALEAALNANPPGDELPKIKELMGRIG